MNLLIQRLPGFCGSQVRRMKTSLAVSTFILSVILSLSYGLTVGTASAAGPSFDCGKAQTGSIEELISLLFNYTGNNV